MKKFDRSFIIHAVAVGLGLVELIVSAAAKMARKMDASFILVTMTCLLSELVLIQAMGWRKFLHDIGVIAVGVLIAIPLTNLFRFWSKRRMKKYAALPFAHPYGHEQWTEQN